MTQKTYCTVYAVYTIKIFIAPFQTRNAAQSEHKKFTLKDKEWT